MATQKHFLDIVVRNKGAAALGNVNKSIATVNSGFVRMRTVALAATGAIAAIGATRIVRGFINTAREVENLRVRFGFLFDTAEEGAKAFDEILEFAGKVPFTLQEIQAAAGVLAVISDDAEQLGQNLVLTGNVAAVAGLDFVTAGEQIQRALSGGIGAADLLREKGVRDLLGFANGVKVTAEETEERFLEVFGPGGKFANAAFALADTLDGTLSMIGDKFLGFQLEVMNTGGVFDTLKAATLVLEQTLAENFGSIKEAGAAIGEGIVLAAERTLIGAGNILDAVAPIFSFVVNAINNVIAATNGLPGYIKTLGVIGFLFLGIKGKLIVTVIAGVFDKVMEFYAAMGDALAEAKRIAANVQEFLGMDEAAKKLRANADNINANMDAIREKFKLTGDVVEETEDVQISYFDQIESGEIVLGKYGQAMFELVKKLRLQVKALEETRNEVQKGTEDLDKGAKAANNFNAAVGRYPTAVASGRRELTLLEKALKKVIGEGFDPMNEMVNVVASGFSTFRDTASSALADVIMGTKSLADALGTIVNQTLKALIQGFINLGITIFILEPLERFLRRQVETQRKINSQLRIELALRTALSFFGGFLPGFADGGPIRRGQPAIVGERGPELFIPKSSGNIISNKDSQAQLSGVGGSGPVTVNFNIVANDTRGFDELLVSRRATIQGIINGALHQKGKMGVV